MHKLFTFLLIFSLPVLSFGQNAKMKKSQKVAVSQNYKPPTSIAESMYRNATKIGDFEVARTALYYMMAEQPENYHLKDSLARIYLAQGYYYMADQMATEVLVKEPGNQEVMEIKAISLQALGKLKESAVYYEKLFNKGSSIRHGYQLAVIQYNLKRFGECNATTDLIIANPKAIEENIYLSYGENRGQEVNLKAACHNLKGVLLKDLKEFDNAKAEFEAAILQNPDFELAEQNLKSMTLVKSSEAK